MKKIVLAAAATLTLLGTPAMAQMEREREGGMLGREREREGGMMGREREREGGMMERED